MRQLMALTVTLGTVMEKGMNTLGLSRSRAQLLWEMHRRGPVTQRELATALSVTPRNVTGLVDALEEAGLVQRQPHPTDRRATLVAFTDAGAALAANMSTGERDWAASLFADLSDAECRDFAATLEKLHAKLKPAVDSASSEARALKRGAKT